MVGFLVVATLLWPRDAASTHRAQAADEKSTTEDKQAAARAEAEATYRSTVAPFLKGYCLDCHSNAAQEGDVSFERDARAALDDRESWVKARRMLSADAMPPADHEPQPSEGQRQALLDWIDKTFFEIDCDIVRDPGRVTIRRLNRAEYDNTIRDLVGVDFEPAADFPSDEVGYGFDNIGDVLSLPPLLLEKYLSAAEEISDRAIVADLSKMSIVRLSAAKLKGDGDVRRDGDEYSLSSNGEAVAGFEFPADGEYILRAEALADQAGKEPARMEFRIDGKKAHVFDVLGRRRADVYEHKLKIKKGKRRFAAAFINDYYNPKSRRKDRDRNLAVRFLEVQGPLGGLESRLPASHKQIIFVKPGKDVTVRDAASQVLTKFATRAFRRPVRPEELSRLVGLVEFVTGNDDTYERGIQVAMQAVLVSPHFLFRVETDDRPHDADSAHVVTDYELASRLSYFLWSSMPDDELFRLAAAGELHQPDVLTRQVHRMLKDDRSKALVENFFSQWLNLRLLDDQTPDPKLFPEFDERLKTDVRRETEKFCEHVVRNDRSILELLDGRYTFLNERLAKHYGVKDVKGGEFRRVELTAGRRAGVLTHASILTLTSYPTRTSPVQRGKWILENVFNDPPPPAPPDVPEFETAQKENPNASLRKQLEAHRKNKVCASCHAVMDPLGFGFENFDAVGRWRDKDGKNPIDASGALPRGGSFNGPVELIALLKTRRDDFSRCMTEKLLTFALGRGLEYYDACAVKEITTAMPAADYRFSALVKEIVLSKPFLMRRGEEKGNEK